MNINNNEIEDEQFVGFLTEMEKFKIIEELSDEILISTVKDQIRNNKFELYQKNNHLETFETRYQNIVNYYKNNDILVEEINAVRGNYYYEIEKSLKEKFGIYVDEDLTERFLIIKSLYNHLVLNSKNTYLNFFFNFIHNNRSSLTKIKETSKSVEAFVLKKKYKNKELINLFSNLYPIVDYILEQELDPSEILKSTFQEGEVDSFVIYNNLSKIYFNDDFTQKFLDNIKSNRSNYFNMVTCLDLRLKNEYRVELNN